MSLFKLAFGLLSFALSCFAQVSFPSVVNITSAITLAIAPACGSINSENFTEINTGIKLSAMRTIVAFGDSWTSNGANGSVPTPPTLWPPLPSAGSRLNSNRRASNGFMWVEDLANSFGGLKLLNYAWGGAVIDNFAWNTTSPNNATGVQRTDFVAETRLFLQQGKFLDALIPSQTLYTVAFGINDEGQFEIAGGDWDIAYNTYVGKLGELQANGAKNILIHGMYTPHPNTEILQSRIFAYLRDSKTVNGTNWAFVDLERLFTSIAANPASFGYKGNATCLISASTTVGGCNTPETSVFYIPGHPSLVTHKIMSDYTQAVLNNCV
ncbi:hypothetical protein C8J56DRAFT_486926 [Mycena floridula]|nr:hypothetical protein C8J56DRAFT_486926 [Mycena floridula]